LALSAKKYRSPAAALVKKTTPCQGVVFGNISAKEKNGGGMGEKGFNCKCNSKKPNYDSHMHL